ncbi:MAG: hypothetical protein KAR31_13400 [Candidatus Omnitrophica bacterium]|nr:hypothetical protein [Candidatus Omnitrophota bacterium]
MNNKKNSKKHFKIFESARKVYLPFWELLYLTGSRIKIKYIIIGTEPNPEYPDLPIEKNISIRQKGIRYSIPHTKNIDLSENRITSFIPNGIENIIIIKNHPLATSNKFSIPAALRGKSYRL